MKLAKRLWPFSRKKHLYELEIDEADAHTINSFVRA
jgi:hypothetical protein